MTQDDINMIGALLSATERDREPTAGCPSGRSRWHTAERLMDEEDFDPGGITELHRVAARLQRKGLVAARTIIGRTRWALTEDGLRVAKAGRRAARGEGRPPGRAPAGRAGGLT